MSFGIYLNAISSLWGGSDDSTTPPTEAEGNSHVMHIVYYQMYIVNTTGKISILMM